MYDSECQAYTVLLDAYRAGGALTDEKRASLEAVAKLLNISTERHKAEVRRAVNDELLNTISTRYGAGEGSSDPIKTFVN